MKGSGGQRGSKWGWREMGRKIGFRIFVLVFLCAVLQVAAVGFLSYGMSRTMMSDSIRESATSTITEAADKLDLVFESWEDKGVQTLSDYAFTRKASSYFALADDSSERPALAFDLANQLDSLANPAKGIMDTYLVPAEGGNTRHSVSNNGVMEMPVESWVDQAVQAGGRMIWVETSPKLPNGHGKSKEPVLTGVKWVRGEGGDLKGSFVLAMEVKRSALNEQTGRLRLGSDSQTYIVDKKNINVFAPDPAKIGQLSNVDLASIQQGESEEDWKTGHTKSLKLAGKPTIVAYSKLQTSGWTLAVEAPESGLLQRTNSILHLTLWMALGAVVLTAVIGYGIIRYVGGPVVMLRNLMKRAEKGDLTVRTAFSRKDEFGELGSSFNEMIQEFSKLLRQAAETSSMLIATGREVLDVSRQTSVSAQEIASATSQIAGGSEALAAEAEKGSELTSDIRSRMEMAADGSRKMAAASLAIHADSEQGSESMAVLSAKTEESKQKLEQLTGKVSQLSDSAASMTGLLHLLQEIAKQTNILSLNAAIEATRAGAAGRGFMVVANEIRQLADRSRQSIEQAEKITERIREEIAETVGAFGDLYPVFQSQLVSVAEADRVFAKVRTEMEAFTARTTEVNGAIDSLEQSQAVLQTAMANVSAVSQQSSATSEEVASLSDGQLEVSRRLVELAERLEQRSRDLQHALNAFTVETL